MNHLKRYIGLIRKAEERGWTKETAPVYVERHHVFPKGIFGENPRKVYLTAREHYVAHALLCFALRKRFGEKDWRFQKMSKAFWAMSNQENPVQRRYKSSSLYDSAKKLFSASMRGENNPMFGREITQATRNKITKKLVQNWEDGTRSREDAGERLKQTRRNPEVELKRISNLREVCGGKTRSDETKLKLKRRHLESQDHTCPHCGKTMKAGNYTRWHGDNCKMKK